LRFRRVAVSTEIPILCVARGRRLRGSMLHV
jgi:hypothetical protein